MEFFQNQHRARRKTGLLVLLFLLAVLGITLAVNGVFYLILRVQGDTGLAFPHWLLSAQSAVCAMVVVAVIALGSLARHSALSGGGEAVAKMAGARRLALDSQDPLERRLRNVIEEMAIASGVVMPELFILDQETSINAFVAGYQPNEAVMVVTRGALEALTRDELQGVVAHEFSHLLNGDMRLNLRLLAILAGILLLGQVGSFMMRSVGRHRARGRTGRGAGALVVVGLALTIIGSIGVFFGRLIKAAVSRQREFLADASAVQFTRQHEGIGGALYKIGLGRYGAELHHTVHAEELNHLCLGETIPRSLGGLLASHPPIDKRLDAIDKGLQPRLQARYGRAGSRLAESGSAAVEAGLEAAALDAGIADRRSALAGPITAQPRPLATRALAASAGRVSRENEDYAQNLLADLPPVLVKALHSTELAVQLCYALLLKPHPANSEHTGPEQTASNQTSPDPAAEKRTRITPQGLTIRGLQEDLSRLGPAYRLPCLELAIAALRPLTRAERATLLQALDRIVRGDGRISLSEWVVLGFLKKHLQPGAAKAVNPRYRSYRAVRQELQTLLSIMAGLGAPEPAQQQALYGRTLGSFFTGVTAQTSRPQASSRDLYQGLRKLNQLSPLLKPAVIDACGDCVSHDGLVSVREYELMRLVADQLDCPLPPLPAPI